MKSAPSHIRKNALDRMAQEESEPTKYWLSSLPVKTSLKSLVKIANTAGLSNATMRNSSRNLD